MAFRRTLTVKEFTPDEILAKLENFCAWRERCPKEVRAKLTELGARGEIADQIYEVLHTDGYFNEARFAHAFAGGKFRINHWGRVRIRLELQVRGISSVLIREALESIDEAEYLARLLQIMEQKKAQYEGADHARIKTAAALARAGFEDELIFRYL
jgi:regulatory protein